MALVIAACYSPTYRDCEVTCMSGTCPAGFTCEQNVCRAPGFSGPCGQMNGDMMMTADADIDGNSMLDSDGDMVNDSIDNCRTIPNMMQYNEDGDTLGDACDPCPPLKTYVVNGQDVDANQDQDGDTVGNGCDPNPGAMGDKIVLFDGFNQQMPATTFKTTAAQVQFMANGSVKIVAPDALQWGAVALPVVLDTSRRQFVRTGFHVNTVFPDTAGPVHGGGVIAFFDGASRGIACTHGIGTQGPAIQLFEASSNNPLLIATGTSVMMMDVDVQLSRRGTNNYECGYAFAQTSATGPYNGAQPPNTRTGVYARSADIDFRWVLIVESPP